MGRRRGKRKFGLRRPKGERNIDPPPPWIELPIDVTANILRQLSPEEILYNAQRVCTTWRSVCAEPSFWRVIHMKYTNTLFEFGRADNLCRRAVDRSRGELIDINIEYFGTNDLLRYISQRSRNLKILSLEFCEDISPGGLTATVKNFPHLEELHLFYSPSISYLVIEAIGVSCTILNSFTFNNFVHDFQRTDDSLALSIAKNMPNLRCLRLVGNRLSNKGLLAILDGCPNLELLDILGCFGVEFERDGLGRRCSELVKKLRRSFDFTEDCEWDDRVYGYDSDSDYSFDDSDSDYSFDDSDSDYSYYDDSDYEDDQLSDP